MHIDLDAVINGKVARGTLPRFAHTSASLAHGDGQRCDGCGDAVRCASTEVLASFPDGTARRFHLDCFGVWSAAMRTATATSSPARPPGIATARRRR